MCQVKRYFTNKGYFLAVCSLRSAVCRLQPCRLRAAGSELRSAVCGHAGTRASGQAVWGEVPWGKPPQTIIVVAWANPLAPKWPPLWLWAIMGLQQWLFAHQPCHMWAFGQISACPGNLNAQWVGAPILGHSATMLPVGHKPTPNACTHPGLTCVQACSPPFGPCRLAP